MSANSLVLSACIVEAEPLRYTPAGIPALNMRLEHESSLSDGGQVRKVKASIKAVAFGVQAETLAKQDLGSNWKFSGFLVDAPRAKHVLFHIQEFSSN